MSRYANYTEWERKRIAAIATQIIASKIAKGEIEQSDEAIKAALPEACDLAAAAVRAAVEFVQ